jgi:replicative DNA helicase
LVNETPHFQGPEKSVISSLLKSPEKLEEVAHLTSEHFHLPTTRGLFQAILRAVERGEQVELVALAERLNASGELEAIGGFAALTEVYTYAPNHAHFTQHVRMLTEKLALRKSVKLAQEIAEAVGQNAEPQDVAELVATGSTAISDTLAEVRPVADTKALILASARRWEDMATGKVSPDGMMTSLEDINQRFRGLKPRRVTVISALPSHGKTLLGGQLFMDCVSEGHRGLFLTWEMDPDELIDRFLAYAARTPINAVTAPLQHAGGEVPKEHERRTMANAFRKVAGMPLLIEAMHGKSITQAIAAIRRHHRKEPLKIVVIDFIQRVAPSKAMEKQSYERALSDVADRFQNLAQELGFHGIVLSQLNKEGAAKHAEAINESCALHLKILKTPMLGKDGTPVMKDGQIQIKVEGVAVVKDRFSGQRDELLPIKLNPENQRFETRDFH